MSTSLELLSKVRAIPRNFNIEEYRIPNPNLLPDPRNFKDKKSCKAAGLVWHRPTKYKNTYRRATCSYPPNAETIDVSKEQLVDYIVNTLRNHKEPKIQRVIKKPRKQVQGGTEYTPRIIRYLDKDELQDLYKELGIIKREEVKILLPQQPAVKVETKQPKTVVIPSVIPSKSVVKSEVTTFKPPITSIFKPSIISTLKPTLLTGPSTTIPIRPSTTTLQTFVEPVKPTLPLFLQGPSTITPGITTKFGAQVQYPSAPSTVLSQFMSDYDNNRFNDYYDNNRFSNFGDYYDNRFSDRDDNRFRFNDYDENEFNYYNDNVDNYNEEYDYNNEEYDDYDNTFDE